MPIEIGLLRHGENLKGPGKLVDPRLTPVGVCDTISTANRAVGFFTETKHVAILSAQWARAKQSSDIVSNIFNDAGIPTTQFGLPHLDAKTALDYIHVLQSLKNLPEFCLRNGLPIPQAAILVTHAHNVVGHFLSKFIDPSFMDTSSEDALFVDCLNDIILGHPREDDFERYRQMMVDPKNGKKAHYSEMNLFKLNIHRWSDFEADCGQYEATIIPREDTLIAAL